MKILILLLLLASTAHATHGPVQPQDIGYSSYSVMGLAIGTPNPPQFLLQVFTSSMSVSISTQGAFDVSGGTTPTLSGCGAAPTISAGSNCERGSLTMGTAPAAAGCVLGFPSICFSTTPKCRMTAGGQGALLAIGQTADNRVTCDTVTTGVATACGTGTYVAWDCWGK
jgi:hypothetical protein